MTIPKKNIIKAMMALLWLAPATCVYFMAFGTAMLVTAAVDGWRGFKA